VRRTLVLVFAATGLALSAGPAAAHASLIDSSPADGETLAQAPKEVVLEFSEPVQRDFAQVVVLDSDDQQYEDGEPVVVGGTVTQAVGTLEAGEYRISYRVGSSDGHPITGVLTFTVTTGPAEPTDGPTGSTGEPTTDPTEPSTRSAGPATAPATPAATTTPAAGADQDSSGLPLWLGAGAAVAAGTALVLLLLRRPGASPPGDVADTGPR
jgi:copper resistance protein C